MSSSPYSELASRGTQASRFMDTVGDGTGSIDMNVNGAITPVRFFLRTLVGHVALLYRQIVHLTDTGSIDSGGFGNGMSLTNGIEIGRWSFTANDWLGPRLTEQLPITTNTLWAGYGFDLDHNKWGLGDESLTSRFSFFKDGGPILIGDNCGWAVEINDDLTSLSSFHIRIGFLEVKI